MERALLKLAQQLNQYDESSLMELWNKYAGKVANFEPSVRWEEQALVFCMIQALHWKNQLFNSELAASARRGKTTASRNQDKSLKNELASFTKSRPGKPASGAEDGGEAESESAQGKKGCKVLMFRPGDTGESR